MVKGRKIMTERYRPEGWKNPYWNKPFSEAFETGADAMLEGLKPLIKKVAPYSKLMKILYREETE